MINIIKQTPLWKGALNITTIYFRKKNTANKTLIKPLRNAPEEESDLDYIW